DHYLEEVIIEFAVPTSWLQQMEVEEDAITLFRFVGGDWAPLDTWAMGSSKTWVYYEASSPGLSVFAVGLGLGCQVIGRAHHIL
ncbi:MAG: PGF-pre-PGF domain-containing protein, partial [Gemmatimonadetes bacterium]|nr:PGF-pre-PGF domain-containing protein [Gemmatimonadota bacterium]